MSNQQERGQRSCAEKNVKYRGGITCDGGRRGGKRSKALGDNGSGSNETVKNVRWTKKKSSAKDHNEGTEHLVFLKLGMCLNS